MSTLDTLIKTSIDKEHLDALLKLAIKEDVGSGDITSNAIVDEKLHAIGRITAKQSLVLAGMDVAKRVFDLVDPSIDWDIKRRDGDRCEVGDVLVNVQGNARALLKGERTALNFLQRLSGIATATSRFVDAVRDTKVKILDTRKTTPGFRSLEKHAVKMGGGTNHRAGLYDHFLIKGNHLSVAGSVGEALANANKAKRPGQLIEVEARTVKDVEEAIDGGADIIMLDNMSVEDVRKAVKVVKGRAKIEVSGNITLDNVHSYAATGVDFISVGAITHSACAADINMLIMIERHAGEHSVLSIETSPHGR